MNVYVATRNRIKLRAVRDVFAEWHRDVEVNVMAVDPPAGLPEQPLGDGVARGAIARAKAGLARSDADVGVGIEAGLIRLPETDAWLSCQVCAVAEHEGAVFLGLGPGYELPEDLRVTVLAGTPLRQALRLNLPIEDAEDRGAIHVLSDGRLDRYGITLDAVRMALVSSGRRWPEVPRPGNSRPGQASPELATETRDRADAALPHDFAEILYSPQVNGLICMYSFFDAATGGQE